ncbi:MULTISPECIES: glutaminase [unclassified Peribacillus]|uniref:glutaminase n=1 Tax=unclassified Peribacillus TaxID=2675266 RepID=UPI0019113E8B|nr:MULTISPECIES: glutaminase [unclassified Peribacillus]MBK5445175.1 glutaminase [Peribacillus sp. TH24]MBK5460102.1 glutaminase [Peribacillus sp. TH27]MBK5481916.1 glutaminase [Peribacillus sp. TH16]MBK5498292.1 glutaminase [Peribacillus sp. TH14]
MVEKLAEEYNIHASSQKKTCLDEWVAHYRSYATKGQTANYIPALRNTHLSQLGICILEPGGTMITSGDWEVPFTLQSISKVLSFIAACLGRGISYVLDRVDVEPTGDAFNSIIRLEMHKPGKPFNPMINAGAITIASLLPGESSQKKLEFLYELIESLLGKRPTINKEVFQSEWLTSHRNRALAHYLKETNYLESDVEEALEVYLKQCSIVVTTEDIALIGLILAQDGYHPIRQEQVLPKEVAKLAKALMLTCGMYNASGKFAAFVGVPAKSGVSGGIMALVPPSARREMPFQDGCGIGIYGPAIDEYGNSVTGGMLLKQMAQEWDLSIF